jgi:hypothetical protein
MPTILIVEKLGNIKAQSLKTYSESELYKKAGFKTNEGFQCHTTWGVDLGDRKYSISLYGKTIGRANQENKYEFPPPVDTVLFFGNCILVNKTDDGEIDDLSPQEWTVIYETLYGGFEDMDDDEEDDEDEDDDDNDPSMKRTKEGYVKDGFIVDDKEAEESDSEESDAESESESEEEEEEDDVDDDEDDAFAKKSKPAKKRNNNNKKPSAKQAKNTLATAQVDDDADDNYLDCTSELSEESYV